MTNFAAPFKLKQHEKVRIIFVGGVTIGKEVYCEKVYVK